MFAKKSTENAKVFGDCHHLVTVTTGTQVGTNETKADSGSAKEARQNILWAKYRPSRRVVD
jgi:hypothetical protein